MDKRFESTPATGVKKVVKDPTGKKGRHQHHGEYYWCVYGQSEYKIGEDGKKRRYTPIYAQGFEKTLSAAKKARARAVQQLDEEKEQQKKLKGAAPVTLPDAFQIYSDEVLQKEKRRTVAQNATVKRRIEKYSAERHEETKKAAEWSRPDVVTFLTYLLTVQKLSVQTVASYLTAMKAVFRFLTVDPRFKLKENPTLHLEHREWATLKNVAESRRTPPRPLSEEEAADLIQYAYEKRPDPLPALEIALGLTGGLRISEVCGLRLKDFDSEKKTIFVHTQYSVWGDPLDGSRKTKTKDSVRKTCLSPLVERLLKEVLESRKEATGGTYTPDPEDFITVPLKSYRDGKPLVPNPGNVEGSSQTHLFKRFYEERGEKPNGACFHALRHTFSTLLNDWGKEAGDVSFYIHLADWVEVTLGHSLKGSYQNRGRTGIAMRYNHIEADPDYKKMAALWERLPVKFVVKSSSLQTDEV